MSESDGILNLIMKKEWFDKIANGEKRHEYRECKPYWDKFLRVDASVYEYCSYLPIFVQVLFRLGYQKNARKMLFEIKSIKIINGKDTDLKIDKPVYDIELGDRIK